MKQKLSGIELKRNKDVNERIKNEGFNDKEKKDEGSKWKE